MITGRLLALAFISLCLAQTGSAETASVPADEVAISTAMTDKSQPARAAWWGFDPADSTESLQAAINSGVRKLIVEDMGAPWITDKITLVSDQEIVFEKGVTVLAKRGAFQGSNDSLFTASLQKNITLTGPGATLRMWKQDYVDPDKYKKAEWRNVLNFRSCANVRVTGLTLADSGGDGIYLGVAKPSVPCSDVVIKGVTCVNNYRQDIIHFEQCHIEDSIDRLPMSYKDFSGGAGLAEITGSLRVTHAPKNDVTYQLTQALIAEWMPFRTFRQVGHFELNDPKFEPVTNDSKPDLSSERSARQRGLSEWLVWAEPNQKAVFTVDIVPVGKGEPRPVTVSLITPSGERSRLKDSPGLGKSSYEFTATESGTYKIACEARNWTATVNSATHRVCLYAESSLFNLLGTVGEFYFWRPAGTKQFAIKVAGGGGTEMVKATLVDPTGKDYETADNISEAHQFYGLNTNHTSGDIWSLRLARPSQGVMEDFTIHLQGVPPVLAATKADLLRTVP